jgi:hypothetical protein
LHGIERYPDAHATLLRALDELVVPPKLVVLRGTSSLRRHRRRRARAARAHGRSRALA